MQEWFVGGVGSDVFEIADLDSDATPDALKDLGGDADKAVIAALFDDTAGLLTEAGGVWTFDTNGTGVAGSAVTLEGVETIEFANGAIDLAATEDQFLAGAATKVSTTDGAVTLTRADMIRVAADKTASEVDVTIKSVGGQAFKGGETVAVTGGTVTFGGSNTDNMTFKSNAAYGVEGETPVTVTYTDAAGAEHEVTYTVSYVGADKSGDDRIEVAAGEEMDGEGGDDRLLGSTGAETLHGGAGKDRLFGRDGNDTLNGDAGDDVLKGGSGNDTLNGGIGDDQIYGSFGDDEINGGDGADKIWAGDGDDTDVNGDEGDDVIRGEDGADILNGGEGDDELYGGAGTNGVETFDASSVSFDASTSAFTGTFNDELFGGAGNDKLYGGSGDDALAGGSGDDMLKGEYGNDILNGGSGKDELRGGEGNDNLDGGTGADLVLAGAGDDVIANAGGNDTLKGEAGNDRITGGDGVDTIHGGTGSDVLTGGDGADVFVFAAGDGADIITDFNASQGDKVDVSALGLTAAQLEAAMVDAADAGDLAEGGAFDTADADTDSVPDSYFSHGDVLVVFQDVATITADDFII